MGFFSFLTRKNSPDKTQNQIKGQSTITSVLRIQGIYPVAGNKPDVLDQLKQATWNRGQAQLSVIDHDIDLDPAAPPPMVPRFRGFSPGCPTAAPNRVHATSLTSRPRSVTRSIRSINSAWSVPGRTCAAVVGTVERSPPVPSIPSHHCRRRSTESFQSSSRFIDVLDAQGEIRSSNFRLRIAATGGREYGEDVAERNIGENGLNLNSPDIKASYRLASSRGLTLQASDSSGLSVRDYDDFDDDDDCAPPPAIPHLGLGTVRDSSRPTSSSTAWTSFSGLIGREMPGSSRSQRHLNERRRASSQTTASVRNRRRSFASTPEPHRSKPRPLSLYPSFSNFNFSAPLSLPPMANSRPKISEGWSRQLSTGMVESESRVDEAFDTPAPCPATPVRFKQAEHHPYSSPDSHFSGQDLTLSSHGLPILRHDCFVPRHDCSHIHLDAHHSQPTHSLYPCSDISQRRLSNSSSMDKPHPRNLSVDGGASLLRHQRLDSTTKHVPVRMPFKPLQPQSYVTPTIMSSGYPSNPFPRSLDQHIPTTSIEASLPPSIKINHKREQRGRMVGLGDPSNHYNAAECDSPADTLVPSCRELKQDLSQPTNAGVEAEYYISEASEDSVDSFIASNEEYHSEEDLLYRGDYGITGGALPGLFDSLPISKAPAELAPIKPPKMPRSTKRPTIRSAASSNRSMPRKTRQQHSHHSRTGTGTLFSPRCEPRNDPSSDEDSNSFWECTCDMPYGPSFVSLADLDIDLRHLGLDQYGLTEEDDVKVDVHTAVKLRKEMQRRRMESRSRRHMRSSVSNNHVA